MVEKLTVSTKNNFKYQYMNRDKLEYIDDPKGNHVSI